MTRAWTRRSVLAGSVCAAFVAPACSFETTWLETVDPTEADEGDALPAAALEQIISNSASTVAFDAKYGGATENHDKIFIFRDRETKILARPDDAGQWAVEHCKVPHARPNGEHPELPPEYSDLRAPDFIAAGPVTKEVPNHNGNTPVVIAHGSQLLLFSMLRTMGPRPETPGMPRKPVGNLFSIGVDLAGLVDPTRSGHRIFLEPDKGAQVHLLPWSGDGPDKSRPGYTVMISAVTFGSPSVSIDTRRLT